MISLSTLSETISFTVPGISLRIDCSIEAASPFPLFAQLSACAIPSRQQKPDRAKLTEP
jgi:hypothetical protein